MATYYVRPDGSDSNGGTGYLASQAVKTISVGLAKLTVAGDILRVAPGFYSCNNVSFPVNGSNGNECKLIGDPWCTYFTDMTRGEVIIAARSALHSKTLSANATIVLGARTYVGLMNVTLEAGTGSVISGSSSTNGCFLNNCNVYGNITGITNTAVTTAFYALNCRFYRTVISTCYNLKFTNCYFANLQMNFGSVATNTLFYTCVIHLSTVLLTSSTATSSNYLQFFGCYIYAGSGGTSAAGYVITAPASTGVTLVIYGCTIEGASNFIDYFTNSNNADLLAEYNLIKDMQCFFKVGTCTGTKTLVNNHFKCMMNCYTAINASYPITQTGGVVEQCVTWGSANVTFSGTTFSYGGNSGGATLTTPNYAAPTEAELRGHGITTSAHMTGEVQSLFFSSKTGNYGTVYPIWVNCTANVQKTVSFKVKSTADVTTGGIGVYFGTASYTDTSLSSGVEQTVTINYTHYATEKVLLLICPLLQYNNAYIVVGNIDC